MEIPSVCPHCLAPYRWELSLAVEQELAWRAPEAPSFLFACAACEGEVSLTFAWRLALGSDPRPLRLAGGPTALEASPRIMLVDLCPHGCGATLGLQLDPDDPWARGTVWPDEEKVLGGYRCPRCDGEGILNIFPVVKCGDTA